MTDSTTLASRAPARASSSSGEPGARAPFTGYPSLVARIGHTALRPITILPADWPTARLLAEARATAASTGLEVALVLGPADVAYFSHGPDGTLIAASASRPPTGVVVPEGLAAPSVVASTPEVLARRAALAAYAAATNPGGYLVGDGLEDGRAATGYDVARLYASGRGSGRPIPPGLRRCPACAELAGDYLALEGEGNGDLTPRVVAVLCRCANVNRCAACGEALAARALSSYAYDEAAGSVSYLAAYAALGHHCRSGRELSRG